MAQRPAYLKDFGKWLTIDEAIRSDTARRAGIVNLPDEQEYDHMMLVYTYIYAPLCERFGKLPVSSFFRSKKLNGIIKGASKTSQHMTGQAIDIDCDGIKGVTNKQLFTYIREYMNYDQIGLEYPDQWGNPGWVHVSFVSIETNRKTLFTATKKKAK